jgi:anti-sigma factor RsiW
MAILEISCVEVWKEISNYIDHDISPDLRARMEEHFKACDHCQAVIDGAQNIVRIVGDDRAFEISPEVGKRLFAKFDKEILKK